MSNTVVIGLKQTHAPTIFHKEQHLVRCLI
nr:MAG TPA: hypothetical protein [Caudoviricetes sp.]